MIQQFEEVHYSEPEQGDILEIDYMEEGLADSLIEDLNQHTNVLMEEEISKQHIEMLPKEKQALRPYDFYFNNCFLSTGFIAYAQEDLLNIEIELIRRIMMKVSQKQTVAVKRIRCNKRKTAEDCESIASGAMQHKVWRPGEKQQMGNCRTRYGIQKDKNPKHMIRSCLFSTLGV